MAPDGCFVSDEGEIVAARSGKTAGVKVAASGNTMLVPSMARTEYLSRNPQLHASQGGSALRIHPADAASHNLNVHDVISMMVWFS